MIALADTGFVVAVANASDQWHAACLPVYRQCRTIFLPQSTLTEVAYLLTRGGGNLATARFLAGIARTKYTVLALQPEDLARTAEILQQYADARVDFVDASVIAVAERLNVTHVLTIDQRDFRAVRPRHCEYFELLP